METYSVAVAAFDFLPVLTTAAALALLARGIASRHAALTAAAWLAALAITLGGASKASWKLIMALHQHDISWLENMLFILMAPGFVALTFALFHTRRAWQSGVAPARAAYPRTRLWLWLAAPGVGALAAALAAPDTRLWFFWLLGVTTLANAFLITQAIVTSRWSALGWPVTACFAYNLLATFALAGLARLPAGEAAAWIQEGVNLSAQAALALGCWQLSRRMLQPD